MSITEQLRDQILAWPGVTEAEHSMGGIEFRLGKRELGHYHDDLRLADLAFPVRIREELVQAGKARPHHIFPKTGWVSYPVPDGAAVPGAIELFRLAYEHAIAARDRAVSPTESPAEQGAE